jgi:phosphomevalonate kinase
VALHDLNLRGSEEMKGEENGQAKLTSDQVFAIYKLAHEGTYTQAAIGAMFDVSATTVCHIKYRRWWRHLWEERSENVAY